MDNKKGASKVVDTRRKEFIALAARCETSTKAESHWFTKGAEWADSHPNWHSFGDLPEKTGYYLALTENNVPMIMIYSSQSWLPIRILKDVKYVCWMEIPTPPAEVYTENPF
jgi:hypothetical protein